MMEVGFAGLTNSLAAELTYGATLKYLFILCITSICTVRYHSQYVRGSPSTSHCCNSL